MIKIKELFAPVGKDDGERIWIEPEGLTRDMIEWCQITHVMSHLGPLKELAEWFSEHPSCFDFFETQYAEQLQFSEYLTSLRGLAAAGERNTFTLVYLGGTPNENSAVVLHRFLMELSLRVQSDSV